MYLSEIKLWNFRKYGTDEQFDILKPSLILKLNKGINVLVGENDSGKTAIIDAIKLVLKTQDYEWIRVSDKDFFNNTNRFRIELEFDDLQDNEAKNFIEWLCYRTIKDEQQQDKAEVYLRLIYDVTRNEERIFPNDICAGADEKGYPLTAEAKEYLKTTYLKPLRDAEAELTPGRNSRLSNILYSSDTFKKGGTENSLTKKIDDFNEFVKDFFEKPENEGNQIKLIIDEFLSSFIQNEDKSSFSFSQKDLRNILSKLELGLKDITNPGLGSLNRLYMAAELLNLKREAWNGVKLCLVEELEAHLHPQAQMKVINKLIQCSNDDNIQFILTTHSPNLTSKLPLENLIYCHNKFCYPMGKEYTKLENDDYTYLQKFLDVTKSNLFFAKGLIFVEGWAEEIFLPSFAKVLKNIGIINKDLTDAGVSIINVGNLAFLRYSKIFQRKDDSEIDIPIAIITDSDIKKYKKDKDSNNIYELDNDEVQKQLHNKIQNLREDFDYQNFIKVFIAKDWTFEFALFKSKLFNEKFKVIVKEIHPQINLDNFEKELAKKLLLQDLSKTEIAYKFATELNKMQVKKEELESDSSIQYLIGAIKFVCK